MPKKIIIIGAGIAGLSAGCYARMNGYETETFEMHTLPGGVCTGWRRNGYTFDGCMHWLIGSSTENPYHRIWEELGALEGKKITNHEEFCRMVLRDGHVLSQYGNIPQLINHLKAEFPEDSGELDAMEKDILLFCELRMPLGSAKPMSLWKKIKGFSKIKPYLPLFKKYSCNIETFVRKFNNPDLREFILAIIPMPDFPATSLLGIMSVLHKKEAGWPEGGSLEFAKSIEKRYTDLGGTIHYGYRVNEIIVNRGRATGIRLADGSVHFADDVIGAADGHSTIFGMLHGKYVNGRIRKDYETMPLYDPIVQVSFGVKKNIDLPRLTFYCFQEGVKFGSTNVGWLWLNNYGFDPAMAPAGKCPLTVIFMSPFDIWEKLNDNKDAYLEEKNRVLAEITTWLESRIPGITDAIEVTDVATPLTTVRYTANYRGSFEGWRPTVCTMQKKLARKLPGLKNFTMIGQWTAGFSGLPSVARDGRIVIEELCIRDGKEFMTSI